MWKLSIWPGAGRLYLRIDSLVWARLMGSLSVASPSSWPRLEGKGESILSG